MTVREVQAYLLEMYAVEVSADLISSVTDAVMAEVTAWQARPLEPMYPVVFFDALWVKIRERSGPVCLDRNLPSLSGALRITIIYAACFGAGRWVK